jgi:hypothetical protein
MPLLLLKGYLLKLTKIEPYGIVATCRSHTNPLKTLEAMVSHSLFLPFLTKTAAESGVTVGGFTAFFVRRTVGGSGFPRKLDLDR